MHSCNSPVVHRLADAGMWSSRLESKAIPPTDPPVESLGHSTAVGAQRAVPHGGSHVVGLSKAGQVNLHAKNCNALRSLRPGAAAFLHKNLRTRSAFPACRAGQAGRPQAKLWMHGRDAAAAARKSDAQACLGQAAKMQAGVKPEPCCGKPC